MAKMIKDTVELACPICAQKYSYARVVKTWIDPAAKNDLPFKGMIRRCKCGSFDQQGRDQKSIVG